MKKYLSMLFCLLLMSCGHSSENAARSPKQITEIWLEALKNKDANKLYKLIDPSSKQNLDSNLRLYLETVQELTGNSKEIQKILDLQGEAFFKAFLEWEDSISPLNHFQYSISEIQQGSKVSTVTILVGDKIRKINLIKNKDTWYIKTDNLESFSQEDKTKSD